jgi:hypothetical protein
MARVISALAFCGVLLAAASPAEAAPRKKRPSSSQTAPAPKPAARTPDPEPATPSGEAAGARRGPSRIEFDDRLVQGQTNKANAIYLFERRESALRSLLKKRTNFHAEMDEMLEDELVR